MAELLFAANLKRQVNIWEECPRDVDPALWAADVADLHRVLHMVHSLFILLECDNEALMRVATEIATCEKSSRRVRNWHAENWSVNADNWDWFRSCVDTKLALVLKHVKTSLEASTATGRHDVQFPEILAHAQKRMRESEAQKQAAEHRADALAERVKQLQVELAALAAQSAGKSSPALAKKEHVPEAEESVEELRENLKRLLKDYELLIEENGRLKVAMEEFRAKLKDFKDDCEEDGIGQRVNEQFTQHGLHTIFDANSVWERLYGDALARIQRLKLLIEEHKAQAAKVDTRLGNSLQGVCPLRVMNLLQESDIVHPPRPELKERQAPSPSALLSPQRRRKKARHRHASEAQEAQLLSPDDAGGVAPLARQARPRSMYSSTSLPALPQQGDAGRAAAARDLFVVNRLLPGARRR